MDKPMPEPTPVTQPFWDGLREHKLRIQYSPSAQQYVFYPRVLAPRTLADDLEWREVSGEATLYTFTVADRPTAPPWQDAVPQLLAVVELAEGPRLTTEMVGVDPSSLQVGMPVKPVFEDHPEITLLKYTV
ncbi:Zn-ribbon domain-containing OB-fold protein [Actinoplanes sp. CA-142083]|uniref:Zn-ribbon domain-containing OB-fold protein n=1 Tax=Actinoplanes sp. CA-142083 TaxID=3239903 RepID=UPI003D943251